MSSDTTSPKSKFKLSAEKIMALSEFSRDLAKILFTSAVVGFFIPGSSGEATVLTFITGLILTLVLLIIGVSILPSDKNLPVKV